MTDKKSYIQENSKPRHITAKINKLLEWFPIVAILGARQVGKTTLAKSIAPNWQYLDLENPRDYARLSHDPILFFSQYPEHIIIDEAQEYPELFKVLRGIVDSNRKQPGRFIITGSSSPDLLKKISETLAGRIATVELGTLKISEQFSKQLSPLYSILNTDVNLTRDDLSNLQNSNYEIHTKEQLLHSWLYGGYPEPNWNFNNSFYKQWMEHYRDTYINRDIAKLFPRLDKHNYQRFLLMLAQLSGTILNKSNMGRALEVSEKTVREYIEIITNTYIWRSIPSYEKNITKTIIKMPKGYIRDAGLLHYLLDITNKEQLYNSHLVGSSFEGFVIEEILKGISATELTNWQANYYRTRNGVEIDLILDGPFGILPIEIKYGSYTEAKKLKSLIDFVKEHKLPFGIVLNQSERAEWLTPEIFQLPVSYL